MENHSTAIPKWSALLVEAVSKPGLIMKAYTAFHCYSTGNQLLALLHPKARTTVRSNQHFSEVERAWPTR